MSSPPTRGRGNVTMKRPVRQKDRPDARTEGLGGRGSQEPRGLPRTPGPGRGRARPLRERGPARPPGRGYGGRGRGGGGESEFMSGKRALRGSSGAAISKGF